MLHCISGIISKKRIPDSLEAYAIDCIFTAVFFCYIGFYNGIGMTRFVIIQEIYETLKKILYH